MLLRKLHFGVIVVVLFASLFASGQSTEFTYQGSLKDGASAANGNYDMEFRLFDIGGSQIGSTQSRAGVAVANGIFSVKLDFGSVFPGADRFLEIAVRTAGGGSFTTLSPRQKIDSSPYSVKSLNATNAENATSAVASTNFTGPLAGDVTGTQSTTTVARIQSRNVANTAPTDGQVLKYNAATAQWRPDTDNTGSGGGITGITAGTGLIGGGTTGGVSLSIANSGVGTAQIADNNVTDAKISGISGAKVTGAVANANNATTAANSTQLGGIPASGFLQNTTVQQASSNFNISGSGIVGGTLSADIVRANTQFNLGGTHMLSRSGSGNLFVGTVATTGGSNTFVGSPAGPNNTNGALNTFVGASAGLNNTTGSGNTFIGAGTGSDNTTGGSNTFVGRNSGQSNVAGATNSFFGYGSGQSTVNGSTNSMFGFQSGQATAGGNLNAFFGAGSGAFNVSGSRNSTFGADADVTLTNLTYATAIGAEATVSTSNTIVLGRSSGADTVRIPGELSVPNGSDAEPIGGGFVVLGLPGSTNLVMDNNEIMARFGGSVSTLALNADGGNVNLIQSGTGSVGIGTSSPGDKLDVDGDIRVGTSGTNGCLKNNNGGTITGTCSSDLRFKQQIVPFSDMLNKVARLRPVSYFWRPSEFPEKGFGFAKDFGLIAQEVEQILPELVSEDASGYKQIDYSRLPLMTIQAVKELASVVDAQKSQIKRQQAEIDQLKNLLCRSRKRSKVCRRNNF